MRKIMPRKRNVVVYAILSILSFGLLGIMWLITLTDEANSLSDEPKLTSGKISFLLVILTLGIYYFYWIYKLGKKIYVIQEKNIKIAYDDSILYLILQFFGLGIIALCMMQSQMNKIIKE